MSALDITASLDVLIRDLRNPKSGNNNLQRTVFFLPTIRNEHNISVLITELLFSESALSSTSPSSNLNGIFYLIEGIKSAANRKADITDPTIPPAEWRDYMLKSCLGVIQSSPHEEWRVLPVLTGLLMSKNRLGKETFSGKQKKIAQDMFVDIVEKTIDNTNLNPIVVFCLAKAQNVLDAGHINQLNHERVLITSLSLIYGNLDRGGLGYGSVKFLLEQQGNKSGHNTQTIFSHLSEFSHLIKGVIEQSQSPMILDEALNMIIAFMNAISEQFLSLPNMDDDRVWNLYKLFLFGLSIQLQGYSNIMLSRRQFHSSTYFAAKILRSLGVIYFIVMHISSSGFAAFEFVYNSCVDVLFESPNPEKIQVIETAARMIAGSTNIGAVYSSLVDRGKITYMLDFFEHTVGVCSSRFVNDIILPLTREFLMPNPSVDYSYIQPVLESAHSVLLAYLTKVSQTPNLDNHAILEQLIPDYMAMALSLFPGILSYTQLNLALLTIMNLVSSPAYMDYDSSMIDYVLNGMYSKIQQTTPGQPLPTTNKDDNDNNSSAPSVYAALGSTLIHSLPFIDEPELFEWWLETVYGMIYSSGPDAAYLDSELWKAISGELSLAMSDIGIRWWYRAKL